MSKGQETRDKRQGTRDKGQGTRDMILYFDGGQVIRVIINY